MTRYESGLSNMSYTNKDFEAVYTELLDLATKLSYKWNPAISDESDPGVVLLKLAAIIADKDNYNIDKNILELFPLSVSQETNARQLFDQCGYAMKYYQAATTELKFTIQSEPEITQSDFVDMNPTGDFLTEWSEATDENKAKQIRTYVIPMFTMVSDAENEHVFTTLEEARLTSDGVWAFASAIQGTIVDYTVNGSTTLTSANLDANYRLYFVDTDVAENGIFISNKISKVTTTNAAGEEISTSSFVNFDEWVKVDNLAVQTTGKLCYKFGIAEDGVTCYIEFPSDIEDLIGNGFCVKYIRTLGFDGNIGRKRLQQFYTDTTVDRYFGVDTEHKNSTILTAEHVYVTNELPVTNGLDPETIDEAYKNYERVKTVFNTLVSTNDYTNYIITNQSVSNAFVCDRTNDIQSTYKILETGDGYEKTHTIVAEDWVEIKGKTNSNGTGAEKSVYVKQPQLDAFDLKIYALAYVDTPTTPAAFVRSFDVLMDTASRHEEMYKVKNGAGIQELKCIQHDFVKHLVEEPLMIKNKYPICAKIIPQYKLEAAQQNEVVTRVKNELYKVLNSRQLKFGDEASYDTIYDTIMAADPRIKAIALDDIQYETFVQYIKSEGEGDNITYQLCEVRIDDYPDDGMATYVDTIKHMRDGKTVTGYNDDEKVIRKKFRDDIYAKSVLAGVTQFLEPVDDFVYSLEQTNNTTEHVVTSIYATERIHTETNHILSGKGDFTSFESSSDISDNEHIMFTAPNLVTEQNYSSYVKYVYYLPNSIVTQQGGTAADKFYSNIKKDTNYQLTGEDFIIFFWKTEDDELAPYKYKKYTAMSDLNNSAAEIIHFNFNLIQDPTNGQPLPTTRMNVGTEAAYTHFSDLPAGEGYTDQWAPIQIDPEKSISMTEYVKSLTGSNFNLTGTNAIVTKIPNTITINNEKTGTNYVAWILNNNSSTNGAVLFHDNETEYTLQSGEYLMYANATKTHLVMLGVGTTIKRTGATSLWANPLIDYGQLLSEGMAYLDDKWFTIPEGCKLEATENEFYQVGPNNKITLKSYTGVADIELYGRNFIKLTYDKVTDGNDQKLGDDDYNIFKNYQITYTDSDSGVSTTIPIRNSDKYGWKSSATLNLNVTPETPMVLSGNQKIILNPVYDDDNKPSGLTLTNCSIISDRKVATVGGRNVDVTTIDPLTGEVVPLQLYTYVPNQSNVGFTNSQNEETKVGGESMNPWSFDTSDMTSTLKVNAELVKAVGGTENIVVAGNSKLDTSYRPNFNGVSDSWYNFAVDICVPTGNYIIPVTVSNPYRVEGTNNVKSDDPVCSSIKLAYHSEFGTDAYSLHDLHTDATSLVENGTYYMQLLTSIDDDVSFFIQENWLQWRRGEGALHKICPVTVPNPKVSKEPKKISGSTYEVIVSGTDAQGNEVTETIEATLFVNGRLYVQINPVDTGDDLTSKNWNDLPLSLYFGKLYRYETKFDVSGFTNMLNKINSLDPNGIFNYTYVIPEDILIKNPLRSETFVESQHVMNPYTIVQWDLYNTDKIIQVSNKVK